MGMSPYLQRVRAAVGNELLLLPAVAGIVFDERGRILLVRQRDVDLWSTPGGSVEPHETPADAVVREVWEETGLVTEPVRILGVFGGPRFTITYPNGHVTSPFSVVFECTMRGGALRLATDETSDAIFAGEGDVIGLRLTDWARGVLPGFFDRTRTGYFEPPTWTPSGQAGL